jgi:DNA-binding PadR family transcriptional regulator
MEQPPSVAAAPVALPDEYGWACVLLLLHERPSSHLELGERLRPLGVVEADPERLPRTLRRLECVGLVRSAGGEEHDSARTYHVTPAGAERLGDAAGDLRDTEHVLGWFLARCGERLVCKRGSGEPGGLPAAGRVAPIL